MKKLLPLLFSISTLYGAVENVKSGNEFLFSNESSRTFFIESEEKGLSLDEFRTPSKQSIRTSDGTDNKFSLGFMMNMKKLPYQGLDASFGLLPLIEVKYNQFFIQPNIIETTSGYEIGYTLYSDPQFLISAFAEYHFGGYEASRLAYPYSLGLEDKNSEFFFGAQALFIPESNPEFQLGIDLTRNFTNSEGMKLRLFGQRYIPYTQDLFLIPGFSYVFLNDDYVNYYYGVNQNEAERIGILPYSRTSGHKFGAHIDILYSISPNLQFRSINAVEFLSNDIVSSPIVNSSINITLGLGIMFTF